MNLSTVIIMLVYPALLYLGNKLSLPYSFASFKDYSEVLLSVSGMVFTIMGIWIAFLYPNALSRLINPQKIETADFSEALSDTKRLESIVGSVLMSAFVMLSILFILLFKLMFNEQELLKLHICFVKNVVLSTVVWLTLLQAKAVANVVYSNIMFLNDLHSKRVVREEDQL